VSDASIICTRLSFSWPDDTPVFQDLSFAVTGGRTGLVAPNGAGKSTLLKLIAGEYRPAGSSVAVSGVLGYLPQALPLDGDLTVAEVLGISEVISALNAIESGDPAEEHFTTIGDDWDIEERTAAQLDRLGLGDLPLTRRLDTLSGGQVVSLGLAAQLLKRPDVLLLDEPTNNLDLAARHQLYGVLENWNGVLLLVSDDRALLERTDRIAELDRGEFRTYGGNFTQYTEAVAAAREVAGKNIRHAEQEVKREKRELQQARERAARRASNASRNLGSAGLPKIFAGTMKRSAQESAGKGNETHTARVTEAKTRLDQAERAVREEQQITLELPGTLIPAGRTVFRGERRRPRRLPVPAAGPAGPGPHGAGEPRRIRAGDAGGAADAPARALPVPGLAHSPRGADAVRRRTAARHAGLRPVRRAGAAAAPAGRADQQPRPGQYQPAGGRAHRLRRRLHRGQP
jgi:ATPase subunit of ABC transporter with duplicated ATPase domains